MLRNERASAGNDGVGRAESRPSRIGLISLDMKQMGARSAGNPHAACDVEGTGNVARSSGLPARQSSTLPVRGEDGNILTYSASSRGQQGLRTTCQDSSNEAKCRSRREPNGSGT